MVRGSVPVTPKNTMTRYETHWANDAAGTRSARTARGIRWTRSGAGCAMMRFMQTLCLVAMAGLGATWVPAVDAAELSAGDVVMQPGTSSDVVVSGAINGESSFGVTILVELIPRAGTTGTLEFTSAPPTDVAQVGDPWPGAGTYGAFDTDQTGSVMLNGSVDDNGTFTQAPVTFSGAMSQFPIVASGDATGVWDVVLSTSAGDSLWEGGTVVTNLTSGTVTVLPSASLSVQSKNAPPGSTVDLDVFGTLDGDTTFGVTILLELIPRAGTTGTVAFTTAPPVDIVQVGDPWPGAGTFSAFDTDSTGSTTLNGSVDDNGTFVAGSVTFSGVLSSFPIAISLDAAGTWDVLLTTSVGDSSWEGILTGLIDGTVTVVAGACIDDVECDDGNLCTDDACAAGTCQNVNNAIACDDGDQCTSGDVCGGGLCAGTPVADGGACDDGDLCTENDECNGGICAGTAIDCSSLDDACNVGVCNAGTGVCEANPINESGPCDDGDPCTSADTCTLGVCAGTAIGDGGACDDGDLCTENDQCTAGVCAGTAVDCSTLDDGCNVGQCNPADGLCEQIVINEGSPCDDGDFCTENDTCSLGVCAGTQIPENGACDDGDACTLNETCVGGVCTGTPVDCSGQNGQCTVGVCNSMTGLCSADPINEGNACDDSDACTQNDTCTAGVCAGTATDCSSLDGPCSVGQCDGVTGACEVVELNEGGSCDDGDLCTQGDTCQAGACIGTALDCSSFDGTCAVGTCNPASGVCEAVPINDGGSCNDGDPCTTGDVCLSGVCGGTLKDCSALSDACNVGSCNPSNGVCRKTPANEGGSCDDGLTCTTGDICTNGVCSGTLTSAPLVNLSMSPSAQTVSVGGTFFVDVRAASGTCADQAFASAEAVLLWDSNLIQLTAFTNPGPHSSSFPDDSDLDGLNAPFTGLPSNDGDAMYLAFAGFSGSVKAPPSGMLLTRLQFTALDGTTGTPLMMPATVGLFSKSRVLGTSGQDITGSISGADITITECQNSADCDDGNLCTTDTCDASNLCVYTNNTLSCDDGSFCTATDTCTNGVCIGSGDPCPGERCNDVLDACVECLNSSQCDDGNPCTNNVCNASGDCTYPNNSLPCNDGLFCTTTDTCSSGVCVGSGNPCSSGQLCDEGGNRCVQCLSNSDCNDGNVCTTDSCDAVTGECVFTNNTIACNDGLFCTATDVCSGGACVGSGDPCPGLLCNESTNACVECILNADCPSDGNGCTDERCIAGECFNINNTLPCNDGLFCTASDVCSSGACVGTGDRCPGELCDEDRNRCAECITNADCDDGIACTTDACTLSTGQCANAPNHVSCNDGVFCNGVEQCSLTLGCVSPGNPCDNPDTCDENADTCGCDPPTVVAEGSRYIRVIPAPGQTPLAVRVTGAPGDSRVSCVSGWVSSSGFLGASQVFQSPSAWGTIHVGDSEIIPSATYQVQSDCRTSPGDPQNLSTAVTVTTWRWGDLNMDDRADFADITQTVSAFRGDFSQVTLQAADLHDCVPNRTINFSDINRDVEAFKGNPYPCGNPCP